MSSIVNILQWHRRLVKTKKLKLVHASARWQLQSFGTPSLCINSKYVFYIWYSFSHSQDFVVQYSRSGNGSGSVCHYSLLSISQNCVSCLCNLLFCWSRGLSSNGRNALIKSHTMIPLNRWLRQPPGHFGFWIRIRREWHCLEWSALSIKMKLGCYYTMDVRKSKSRI